MDVFALSLRLKEEGGAAVKASVDKLNRSFDEASAKAKMYDMTVGSLKDTLSGLASGLALGAVMTKIIDETSQAEFAAAQLNATLQSTKGVAGQSAEALNAHAMALSQMSIFDDDAITGAQSLLLTFTKIHGDTFPKATQAVLNVATAMGTDLKSAAIQVGKALNDPIQGVSALARSGIQFTDAQKEMIAKLVETNRLAQAQAVVLAELETQFGGSAEAARNTFGGAIKALNNELGNLLTLSQNNSSATVQFINLLTNAVVGLNDVLGELGRLLQTVNGRFEPFLNLLQRASSINMFTPLIVLAARGKQVAADVKDAAATMGSAFKLANAYTPFGKTGPGTAVPKPGVAPKPTGAAIPKIPNLPALKKEAALTMSQISEAFVPKLPDLMPAINQGATDWLAASAKAYEERINELAMQIKFALGDTLGNALADGIQTAIEQKSIGAGFKAMTQTLLRGLGDMMIQFGKASLVASTLMDTIFKALAKALPGGAIVASLAMIAAGAALKGAAGAAFGGGGGGGGGGGFTAPMAAVAAGAMTLPTQFYGPTAAGSSATIAAMTPMNVTIVGPNDPAAQRQMQELMRNAQRRGSV